ncbi:MAG: zinc-binding dehydrogenase [Solirubrobacteraceae bacterium]
MIRDFGVPGVLKVENLPDLAAGLGEVVIDVEYASITFVETQARAGCAPNAAMASLPLVPGNGVGGWVAEVGEGVGQSLLGRAVVTTTGGRGGYAERVVVPGDLPIEIPDGVSIRDAVALLADGRTALALARVAAPKPGEVVLVEAAAGGVGTCLIQLMTAAGATVVAGVGSPRKMAVARGLGADTVVDYSLDGWEDEIRGERGGLAVVFDGVGGEVGASALALLRPGGRFCQYGMASGRFTDVATRRQDVHVLRGTALSPAESRELSIEALRLAAAGKLIATVGQEYPLEQAAAAHAAIESRSTIGKTLLRVRAGASPGALARANRTERSSA